MSGDQLSHTQLLQALTARAKGKRLRMGGSDLALALVALLMVGLSVGVLVVILRELEVL